VRAEDPEALAAMELYNLLVLVNIAAILEVVVVGVEFFPVQEARLEV
jgi:hypothetical protein